MNRGSLVILLGFCVLLAGCGSGSRSGAQRAEANNSSRDTVSTFTLVGHAENGRKKWEVSGESADLLGDTVDLSPVSARSFGEVDVHLTARKGRFNKQTQDVHLERDVVVTTSDGARLTTETLDWSGEKGVCTTPDWITMTRPDVTVEGKGGIGTPKLKRVRVEKQVTVKFSGENGPATVTCDGPMEVDYGRKRARFWRNVQVRDAQGVIRSDRMDVILDSVTNQLERANFWGHVQVTHKSQLAFAQRANYWKNPSRTRLQGHTRVVMLSGAELRE